MTWLEPYMYTIVFRVETSKNDSPKTTQRNLKEHPKVGSTLPWLYQSMPCKRRPVHWPTSHKLGAFLHTLTWEMSPQIMSLCHTRGMCWTVSSFHQLSITAIRSLDLQFCLGTTKLKRKLGNSPTLEIRYRRLYYSFLGILSFYITVKPHSQFIVQNKKPFLLKTKPPLDTKLKKSLGDGFQFFHLYIFVSS